MGGLLSYVVATPCISLFFVVTFLGLGCSFFDEFLNKMRQNERRVATTKTNKEDKREILCQKFMDDDDDDLIFVSLESRRFFQIIYKSLWNKKRKKEEIPSGSHPVTGLLLLQRIRIFCLKGSCHLSVCKSICLHISCH